MIKYEKIWSILIGKFPVFMNGVSITLKLAFFTVLFGTLLGVFVTLLRRSRIYPLRWLMNGYVAFIRGTPLLVQALLLCYGFAPIIENGLEKLFPASNIEINRMSAATIALIINSSAYMSEIIRAGIQNIDRGQSEAAESLGMSRMQTMLYIVLPQAVKATLPAMGNEFVVIIKESSILYSVGVYELTYQAQKLATTNYLYIETMIDAAIIYFVLTYTTSRLLGLLERRMHRSEHNA